MKGSTMEHKQFKLPIFHRQIWFYKNAEFDEIMIHFNKQYKSDIPYEPTNNLGTCLCMIDGSGIVMIHKESHGTVAHELNHLINGVMVNLLKDTDRRFGDETYSYLIGYVTDKYYESKGWKTI